MNIIVDFINPNYTHSFDKKQKKTFPISLTAYTGYRRSIDGVLEATSNGKSNATDHQHNSSVDGDNNHTKLTTTTATIIAQSSSDQQNSGAAPPQPAPRTRLSSQNSIPANGSEPPQVRVVVCARITFLFNLVAVLV